MKIEMYSLITGFNCDTKHKQFCRGLENGENVAVVGWTPKHLLRFNSQGNAAVT